MKFGLSLWCFTLLSFSAFGQVNKHTPIEEEGIYAENISKQSAQQVFVNITLSPNESILTDNILQTVLQDVLYDLGLSKDELFLEAQFESPEGIYYSYLRRIDSIDVYGQFLKIFLDKNKNIRRITWLLSGTCSSVLKNSLPENSTLKPAAGLRIKNSEKVWFFNGQTFELLWKLHAMNLNSGLPFEYLINSNGTVYYKSCLHRFFNKGDSIGKGKIFNPDPLTSAQVPYAGAYIDNFDKDTAVLTDQLQTVFLRVKVKDGLYYLADSLFYFEEIEAPLSAQPILNQAEFYFTRSQLQFEFVNAYFHLTNFRDRIHQYGYTSLPAFRIQVDPHAFNGADASAFSSFFEPPALLFGIGGIDDAEDADVIIHEFGHALVQSAAPNSTVGLERRSLEEGLGDYFAMSYSRSINGFNWQKIFNWDGNVTWQGRRADSKKIYPEDITGNIYTNGEILLAALAEVYSSLGQTTTDKLVLGSLYGLFGNMSMQQYAQTLLQMDSLQNQGKNTATLHYILAKRGFIESNTVLSPLDLDNGISVLNSYNFAFGLSPLSIRVNDLATRSYKRLNIYTSDGKLYLTQELAQQEDFIFLPQNFRSGLYLFQFQGQNQNHTIKIIRH